jgi:acyl-CoA thioesterase
MSDEAVFREQEGSFIPSAAASGPWGADKLHGGPVFGLLTRAVERAAGDAELIATRLTFDLYRAVPMAPLSVHAEVLRQSGRLRLLHATLRVGDEEYVRATALLLRPSAEDVLASGELPKPAGPAGLTSESLMRGARPPRGVPAGFHTRVETRWVPHAAGEQPAIWFRLPIPLVAGETPTSLQLATSLGDFANAIASISAREHDPRVLPYVNIDTTTYLTRKPEGEWICLQAHSITARHGISVTQTALFDERGAFGSVMQSRLVQQRGPS